MWTPSEAQQPGGLTPIPTGGQPISGIPTPFSHWPQNVTPDAVIVLSGQTMGYLRPCGCSEHQLGGLERRNNLIQSLKKKNWPVVAVDLGDVPASTGLHDQIMLKYKTAMQAMKQMGYIAVGIGLEEFRQDLDDVIGNYSLQPGNEKPRLLAANLKRTSAKDLATSFPTAPNSPLIVDAVVTEKVSDSVSVAVVGSIESTDAEKANLATVTKQFELLDNATQIGTALKKAAADPLKPEVRVLLFQGSLDASRKAAEAFPQFQIILCKSDQALPPQQPVMVNNGKTSIIQVGLKGQYVGVAGVFKQPDGSFKIEYQLIELNEQYLTPKDPAIEANDPILKLLQQYSADVKVANFLKDAAQKKTPHNAQILFKGPGAKPTYVGSEACKMCHPKEFSIWADSKHSHALNALEDPKIAFRPTGRNFDPECVTCHVVGFEFDSGFESKEKTPKLQHVGCENCHGPGSAHMAAPTNKQLLALMSPWKTKPTDLLPKKELMEEIGKKEPLNRSSLEAKFTINEQITVKNVTKMCMSCHNDENDPKFDLYKYMPKITHTGFKPGGGGGLPPGFGK
ncbi:MAG: multiheme c-type cytochrome [Gemmataceae bacterium]